MKTILPTGCVLYASLTSPSYLKYPLLQRKVKTKDGLRTVAGLGSWTGWIFSEEMYNSIPYGYKFEVIRGYTFNKGNVFAGYVDKLYKLRLDYPKAHPLNLIAKLLLNSLYGKFGMKSVGTQMDLFDISSIEGQEVLNSTLEDIGELVFDHIPIDDDNVILLSDKSLTKEDGETYHGLNVNVAIASAITSYARNSMSYFKNNPNFNLYYSDTD